MTPKLLTKLLTEILPKQVEFGRDGDRVRVPPDREATVFSTVGSEAVIIDKVVSLQLLPDVLLVVIETSRGERYFVAYEDVRAVRVGGSRSGAAGYA